ncbi:MAG: PD-(D/E)XK nuclease family protein [Deltaproteobacteria bacterium]|nr:PD-(D/E)XK nuclease family protein [Deltaproteobacteria bacterium]
MSIPTDPSLFPEPPPIEEAPAWTERPARPPLENRFSWSPSRARLFGDCRRAYWYRYYGQWFGWEVDAPAKVRIAYRLGKMDTLDTWAGTIVHDLIEQAIKKARWGRPIRGEELRQQARARLRVGWVQSRDGHWRHEPKRCTNLMEHYYADSTGLGKPRTDAIAERVYTALDNFVNGPFPELLARLPRDHWRSIEGLDSLEVAGQTVYVKPDLAFEHPDDGTTWLVDWKTGLPSDKDDFQVATYALFAGSKWGVAPESCRGVLVYLGLGEEKQVDVTAEALAKARAAIEDSIAAMREPLREVEKNVADRPDFPMTDDRTRCGFCAFRQLCFGGEGVPGAALAEDPENPGGS